MIKVILSLFFLGIFIVTPSLALAKSESFITIVNPIRGEDFWQEKNQGIEEAVLGQKEILKDARLPATWLLRFDALGDKKVVDSLSDIPENNEKGLFLEVTPSWTKGAKVEYINSNNWHSAKSVFLTGYSQEDRKKLIDTAFEKFNQTFGEMPKSVGAWYIDSFSLDYMASKYKITAALIVSDQYTTDDYQVWGQYWSYPYYPSKKSSLKPAQSKDNKIPVVLMQWAARDPINAYGDGAQESTYSVQANDYIDFHKLDISYFEKLVDTFTNQELNQVNQIVVGLENSYSWERYKDEYRKQIEVLVKKQQERQLRVVTMDNFSAEYGNRFPNISPEQVIVANDSLGTFKKVVWFMNPFYRVGWFVNQEGSVFRDIRQYIDGQMEPCFERRCEQINFATFATRVLDEVTYKQRLVVDKGEIDALRVSKNNEGVFISYENEAGRAREIKFLERDIVIDGSVKTIDGIILEAQNLPKEGKLQVGSLPQDLINKYKENTFDFTLKIISFLIFIFGLFLVGYLVVKRLGDIGTLEKLFLSICLGFVLIPLVGFVGGYLGISWLNLIIIGGSIVYFIFNKEYRYFRINKEILITLLLISPLLFVGTFFQSYGVFKSGWVYDYGVGFWGPTAHDLVWHQALSEELIKNVPPNNPILSGERLTNYHYFYNLLIAETSKISRVATLDLIYRFYPILFSLFLGVGTYLISNLLFRSRLAAYFSVFFVYFGGSFGWIVQYIKDRSFLGGESAFWANQPISMNINPPFAISLIILIGILLLFKKFNDDRKKVYILVLALLIGTLVEFKVYGAILVYVGLFVAAVWDLIFKKRMLLFVVFIISSFLSAIVFLPQNSAASDLLIISPFWFVHSMIDFPDRLGWERLSMGRMAYLARGDWGKFTLVEGLGLGLFIIGNLGTRVVAIINILKVFNKSFWRDSFNIFIIFSIMSSVIIPLLFIQKGNPWNTIQFFYYFLFFISLFAGLSLSLIYQKLPKQISILIITLIILITPISSYSTFKGYFVNQPHALLPLEELDALTFLKSKEEGTILTYPYDNKFKLKFIEPFPLYAYETNSYVSGYSGKQTFLEDEIQQEIFQNNYKDRIVKSLEFFNEQNLDWSTNFLKENNIKYIYLPFKLGRELDEEKLPIKKIFERDEVKVYEVE